MALTNKHYQIQQKKTELSEKAKEIIEEINAACNKVPAVVLSGKANIATAWRDRAEAAYQKSTCPRSLTLPKMIERLDKLKNTLEYLRNPTA